MNRQHIADTAPRVSGVGDKTMALYEISLYDVLLTAIKANEKFKKNGITTFTAPPLDFSEEINPENRDLVEFERKLGNALKRLTGYSCYSGGHFGEKCKTGGIHPVGKYRVRLVD